jgi:hypothetical protein
MKRIGELSRVFALVTGFALTAGTAAIGQVSGPRRKLPTGSVTQSPRVPEPPVRYEPSAELKNLAEAQGIRDVTVEPGETTATITFRARSGSAPVVEIGGAPPKGGLEGQLEFPARYDQVVAEVVRDDKALTQVNFRAQLSSLDRGTKYYFIITVPGSDGTGTRQIKGSFTTQRKTAHVTVVFTEINVIRGEGDLFDFWVGDKHFGWIGSTDKMLNWDDDDGSHQVNKTVEFPDAPDSLEIFVNGCVDTSYFFENNGCAGVHSVKTEQPEKNSSSEVNVAKQTFALREMPGSDVRREFTIESAQSGSVELAFRVTGYFIITRE